MESLEVLCEVLMRLLWSRSVLGWSRSAPVSQSTWCTSQSTSRNLLRSAPFPPFISFFFLSGRKNNLKMKFLGRIFLLIFRSILGRISKTIRISHFWPMINFSGELVLVHEPGWSCNTPFRRARPPLRAPYGCTWVSSLMFFCRFSLLLQFFGESQKGTAGRGREKKCHDNLRQTSRQFTTFYDNLRHFMTISVSLFPWHKTS